MIDSLIDSLHKILFVIIKNFFFEYRRVTLTEIPETEWDLPNPGNLLTDSDEVNALVGRYLYIYLFVYVHTYIK